MSWTRAVAARFRSMFRRKRLEGELEDELRFHLDMQMDDNINAGMSPAEARYAALRSFGPLEPMKESYRDRRTFASFESMVQDVRYAVRILRRSPGFTTTAIATLALAIGANTAMFSIINAVLLRPLPYENPEQLAMLWTEAPRENLREGRSAYANVEYWREHSDSFADIAVFDPVSATLTGLQQPERVTVARISPNFFPLLGIHPAHGRIFSGTEAEQRERLALISDRFWKSRFGGSHDAIGASIVLDGQASRIVGILPERFRFVRLEADIWEPHTMFPDWDLRRSVSGVDSWFVVGRLRPGASFEQAQAEMATIASRLDAQLPASDRNRGIRVSPLRDVVVGSRSRLALWMLACAILSVLLIAAANITSLSLARSVGRAREMAIRASLGASPMRIVRQLLAESLTLTVIAGLIGSLLGLAAIRVILTMEPFDVARLDEVSVDFRVLLWALAISSLTGAVIGLAPAVALWHRNLRPSAEGGRSVSGGVAARRIRRTLVTLEVAAAMVLLTGAGLLVRSWWHVERIDPGFRTQGVVSMELRLPVLLPPPQRAELYRRVLEEVESLPQVERAGFTSDLFISSSPEQVITAEAGEAAISDRIQFRRDEVSAGYFEALRTPLRRGRFFSVSDGPESPRVAIINESFAQRLWQGDDPVGRRFKLGAWESRAPWFTVAGVVADMRRQGLEREPIPQVFESLAQNPSGGGTLLVRTSADDPLSITTSVQAAVRRVIADAPLYDINTLENRLGTFLLPRRVQTSLVVAFSAVALLLAAIGIYGLVRYSIATRTKEIGIRLALGADAGTIFRMVVGDGLRLTLTGLGLGLAGAIWVGQAGRTLLFGVTAADPLTLITVSLLLIGIALCACCLPARRAMKVEPVSALRQD